MNVVLRRPMTLAEFLDWEERQEYKHEFDGVGPVAMTGGTVAHAIIGRNLVATLATRLRGKSCKPFGSDLKIQVGGSIRYPDAFVVCTPVSPKAKVVQDPVVIFEVLSDSTAHTDRGRKNEEYRDTPSVMRYVMLEQDSMRATMFAREEGRWVGSILSRDAVLAMPEIGIEIPLAELYEGVDFPPESA
ncbi:MAG TPA: Uma2 family endonuclease [Acetobacteraceae bacterium]|nr:Uma2 family endonuclease [Acetobacteraceae bacterium]